MKISPVQGTPTIPNPSHTGLAPDKLARIKGIAAGEPAPEPTEEEKNKLLAATQKKIVMNTNKTVNRTIEPPVDAEPGIEIGNGAVNEAEIAKTDASVQPAAAGTEAKEGGEATQPLSPQLAMIARQRRALDVKEKELEARAESIKAEALTEYKSKLKSNALGVLLEEGVSYDQLTQEILGNQSNHNPEVEALKAEVAELKKGVDDKFSKSEEAQETHAINYVADKLDTLIGVGDEFDLLKAAEGEEEVIRRVYTHWKKTGKELDVAVVAKEYQEELAEEVSRYAKTKSVQKRLTPLEEPLKPQPQQQTGIRTLTNKDSARAGMDRKTRAILAMQGQLKR